MCSNVLSCIITVVAAWWTSQNLPGHGKGKLLNAVDLIPQTNRDKSHFPKLSRQAKPLMAWTWWMKSHHCLGREGGGETLQEQEERQRDTPPQQRGADRGESPKRDTFGIKGWLEKSCLLLCFGQSASKVPDCNPLVLWMESTHRDCEWFLPAECVVLAVQT